MGIGIEAPHAGSSEAPASLKRTLGLRTVVSTSAGLTFASSTFLVVAFLGHSLPGDSAWLPIALAGLLCLLAASCFSELNGMYPSAAGIRLWLQRSFGEKTALVTSLTYMSVVALVVGTEAYVLSYVLSAAIPSVPPVVWIVLMLTVATLANIRGLRVAGAMQDIITYSVVVSIFVMSILALARVHFHVAAPGSTGGIGNVGNLIGFAIFLFVGFEWVTPLAEEVREPRSIPYGMFIALGLLVAAYSLVTTAMFADPSIARGLYGSAALPNPIPHITFARAALGPIGMWAMIATSLCMSITTFNAGLISVSRFVYASAREHVLPKALEKLSVTSKETTPVAAIWAVYCLALATSLFVYFTKHYVVLVNLAAATEALIYAWAAACVVMLRLREAALPRPYRVWGGIWLPGLTCLVFLVVGVAVFFTKLTFDYFGAGIIIAVAAAGWYLYVHYVAMPRKERVRAELAAKRKSRRPVRSAEASTPEPVAVEE